MTKAAEEAPDLLAMRAAWVAERSAADAVAAIAALRRAYIAEAIDGMIFQGEAVRRFLASCDDGCAAAAMGRMFDFARRAAPEMNALRAPPELPRDAQLR